jgi:hypothetical protein
MPNPLTEEEKARVRHHTGYPEVQPAASIQFGLPRPLQAAFLLESAMGLVLPSAVPRIRDILQILDDLEQKMVDAQCYLVADQLDTITLAGAQDQRSRLVTDRLESEYVRWAERLVDIFGVPLYPFSSRFNRSSSAARVLPVRRG